MVNLQKYSMIGVMARLFNLARCVFDYWRPQVAYALLLTILMLITKQVGWACMDSNEGLCGIITRSWVFWLLLGVYVLIYIHLFLAMAVDFYDAAFNKIPFTISLLWRRSKEKWQKELFLFAYVLSFLVPFVLALKFLLQPANPNWRIEFIYFTFIFAAFIFILLLIRMTAALSRYLATKRADFALIYRQTGGQSYVAIMTFLILLALILLSCLRLGIWFDALSVISPWLKGVALFLKNVFILLFTALMLVFFRAQDELLANEKIEQDK